MPLTPEMLEPAKGNPVMPPASQEPTLSGNPAFDAIEVTSGNQEDETSATPVGTPSEGVTQEAEGQQPTPAPTTEPTPPAAKQVYTNDEIVQLLNSEQDIDTDRLSPEGKLLMKSFQTGYNKKFEKLSEKQRHLDEQVTKPKESDNPREKYYQTFLKAPDKVISEINAAISELEVDPYNEENRKTLSALRQMKDEFIVRRTTDSEKVTKATELALKTRADIYSTIPDFEKKVPLLNSFATTLGFDENELSYLTNPMNTGPFAAKLTKALNKAYDIINANKTLEKKVDKTPPPQLGKSGISKDKPSLPTESTQEDFEKWWNENTKH